MNVEIARLVGENCLLYRRRLGLRQKQVVHKLNMPDKWLYEIEAGKSKRLTLDMIKNLAEALGVSPDDLLD
jgi:transcriptional regulator with XRE-family HTH domain